MGRPKASPEQQLLAHEYYKQGFKPKAISIKLEQEFEEPVSLSSVEKWCRAFRDNPTGDDFLDSPFQWEQMEQAGIPWEAGRYLLSVWKRLTSEGQLNPPSFRHMKWWWRVHLAKPNLEFSETLKIVIDAEMSETGINSQDELSLTRLLVNSPSRHQTNIRRERLRDILLKARSNNVERYTQESFFDKLTFGKEGEDES